MEGNKTFTVDEIRKAMFEFVMFETEKGREEYLKTVSDMTILYARLAFNGNRKPTNDEIEKISKEFQEKLVDYAIDRLKKKISDSDDESAKT